MRTELTEDDIKGVLARAEEINLGTDASEDSDVVLLAAEEAGLPREAIEQALREQIGLFSESPKVDDLVFAKSTDDHHYIATVTAVIDNGFHVRFLKGGESKLPLQHLRPCGFLPGEELTVHWPWWGWWVVTVLNYDSESRRVRVSDGWGSEEWFSLTDVRLDPARKPKNKLKAMVWTYTALIGVSGIAGAVVTWLAMR